MTLYEYRDGAMFHPAYDEVYVWSARAWVVATVQPCYIERCAYTGGLLGHTRRVEGITERAIDGLEFA